MSNSDIVSGGPFQVGNFDGDLNMLNFVAGANFGFSSGGNLSVAYTGPMTGGSDRSEVIRWRTGEVVRAEGGVNGDITPHC